MAEKEWLECLPWDQSEKSLPLGGKLLVPGLSPEKLVKAWEVLDAESEEGSRKVKAVDLKPEDIIIGCEMNRAALARLATSYGPGFVQIKQADGSLLSWQEWQAKYGTDGLALWAIRNKRNGYSTFKIGGN
jgi:hypothetical protein